MLGSNTLFYLGENDSFAIDLNNDNIDDLKFERETNYGSSPSGGDYFISSFRKVSSLNEDLKISLGKQHPNSVLSYSGWNCLKFSADFKCINMGRQFYFERLCCLVGGECWCLGS